MNFIYIGRIITTHGIKGEIKIRSNFKYKDRVFAIGQNIYLGKNHEKHKILSYRVHKDYDMVILDNLDDISKVIPYKGSLVFFNKEDLFLENNEYVNEDFIDLEVYYNNKNIGKVISISDKGNGNEVFVIKGDKTFYVPKNNNFILEINLKERKLILKNLEGLL